MIRLLSLALPIYSLVCVLALVTLVTGLISYLFINGWHVLDMRLIFGYTPPLDAILLRRQVFDGLFPALFGTFSLVLLSLFIALPVGVGAGIFLAEYAKGPTRYLLTLVFDVLAGVPSVVIGLFGFAITVLLHQRFPGHFYPCMLLSALALAFLVLPYLVRTTQNTLSEIDPVVRQTALALGASRFQNIVFVLIPDRLGDIASGVFLALGRCAEDTAVIMLTGVVVSAGIPKSLTGPYEALPFYIYYISSQYTDRHELATGFAAAIILLLICSILLLMAFILQHRLKKTFLFR